MNEVSTPAEISAAIVQWLSQAEEQLTRGKTRITRRDAGVISLLHCVRDLAIDAVPEDDSTGEITVSTPEKELPEYLPAEIPEDRIIRGKQGEVLGYVCAGFARAEDGHVIPEGAAGPSRSAARARLLKLGLDGWRADSVLDYAYGTGLVQAAPLRQDGGDQVAIVSCYGDETGVTYIVTGVTTTEEA